MPAPRVSREPDLCVQSASSLRAQYVHGVMWGPLPVPSARRAVGGLCLFISVAGALQDLLGIKADEALKLFAKCERLGLDLDQQGQDMQAKEADIGDKVQKMWRLNNEMEEALNRRNTAMNTMFSSWMEAQLPTNISNGDPVRACVRGLGPRGGAPVS